MSEKVWKYADIVELPHHVSKKHPPMEMIKRAAQFAPFAALTGYGDAVKETARLTEGRVILSEDALTEMDRRIGAAMAHGDEVEITCFVSDERKEGGRYETVRGRISRIEMGTISLDDGTRIMADTVTEINLVTEAW